MMGRVTAIQSAGDGGDGGGEEDVQDRGDGKGYPLPGVAIHRGVKTAGSRGRHEYDATSKANLSWLE